MQMGNWTNLQRFGCTLISVKVFVEVVTALLLNATTVATFVRSCVAQALRRGGGLRHSLHAWA